MKLSNGEIFEGEFKKDKIEGVGYFISMSGSKINGIWKDSKLIKLIIWFVIEFLIIEDNKKYIIKRSLVKT